MPNCGFNQAFKMSQVKEDRHFFFLKNKEIIEAEKQIRGMWTLTTF